MCQLDAREAPNGTGRRPGNNSPEGCGMVAFSSDPGGKRSAAKWRSAPPARRASGVRRCRSGCRRPAHGSLSDAEKGSWGSAKAWRAMAGLLNSYSTFWKPMLNSLILSPSEVAAAPATPVLAATLTAEVSRGFAHGEGRLPLADSRSPRRETASPGSAARRTYRAPAKRAHNRPCVCAPRLR